MDFYCLLEIKGQTKRVSSSHPGRVPDRMVQGKMVGRFERFGLLQNNNRQFNSVGAGNPESMHALCNTVTQIGTLVLCVTAVCSFAVVRICIAAGRCILMATVQDDPMRIDQHLMHLHADKRLHRKGHNAKSQYESRLPH